MGDPIQFVIRLPRRDGGQVVEGFQVAAVLDVGSQPSEQAATQGYAGQHLSFFGAPFCKCAASPDQVLIHLEVRHGANYVLSNFWKVSNADFFLIWQLCKYRTGTNLPANQFSLKEEVM